MIFADLPSPAKAGFAKAENRFPLFGIMRQWLESLKEKGRDA
jgi:hypothetical protein